MTRKEAINVIKGWVLADKDREALETILPELKKDDRERIKENCIHFLELQKSHHASTVEIDECIDWLIGLVPPKWLYRLEYKDGTCGLWYNGEGKWCFEQEIGSLVGCKTKDLPMDHDERYKQDGRDWFSSCSNKEDLLHWYSLKDAEELIKKGFVFTRYLATEYHEYENETVFIKESSLIREEIDIFELFGKTKPMFKEGNWLQYRSHKPFLVEEITEQGYVSGEECLPFEWENEIHLWTLQDAKPGDIIVEGSRYITIYQSPTPNSETTFRSFCFVDLNSDVFVDEVGSHNIRGSYPATKEQRDLLFQKIKEVGYWWDADKLELKKIEQKPSPYSGTSFEYNGHTYGMCARDNGVDILIDSKLKTHVSLDINQNPSWNEEDENNFTLVDFYLNSTESAGEKYSYLFKWFKSLKDRVQPHPKQEWSEEDERKLQLLIVMCDETKGDSVTYSTMYREMEELKTWLKYLKERYTWKPSEEQRKALLDTINYIPGPEVRSHLSTLYEQLREITK